MSKVYTQKIKQNIWITDRRQRLIKNSLIKLTSRITEGEIRNFKINLKQTLITTMVT